MDVDIKHMPKLRVGTVRHVGPYNQIPKAFEQLGAVAGPSGLLQKAQGMIAIYHDDPETTPQDQLRSDAALVVPYSNTPAQVPKDQLRTELYVPLA